MIIPCKPPALGRKLADTFQPIYFDKADTFLIRQARLVRHTPYARILSTNATYARQLTIRRALNGTDLGHMFNFGGESDTDISVDWRKSTMPITAPMNYLFTALSWHSGQSRGANRFELTGSIHERGIHFRIGVDDAGCWAHGGVPDEDFKGYVMEFVVLIPGQPNWLVHIQPEGIVIH